MLNFQLTLLTAKAIIEAKNRIRMTDGMVIRAEFQAYCAKPPWVQALMKLSKLKAPSKLK